MVRIGLLALLATACATAVSAKYCTNVTVPVTVSARNGRFNLQPPSTAIDTTNFILRLGRRGTNYTQESLKEIYTVSGTYSIAATYCQPQAGQQGSVLQILTHGIGFDRSYWDFPYNNYNYSYVDRALAKGYSTFSYDRFGIGGSSQRGDADPINVIQSWLEIAVLAELTKLLRANKVQGVDARPASRKYVHVGHSFGSIQSYALAASYPTLTDGIILTGFSQAGDYMAYFAYGTNWVRAASVPGLATKYPRPGYLAPATSVGVHQDFFAPGNFDRNILPVAAATGQPVTYGELLTIGPPASMASRFGGPVLIITGDQDIPFCGGNCTTGRSSSLLDVSASLFRNSSHFETFVVPGTGHGLNYEYSWPTTYGKILGFLDAHVRR